MRVEERKYPDILQGELREIAEICVMKYLNMEFKEKQKGRNHDLSVMEYKVKKETEKVEELDEVLKVQRKQNEKLCEKQIEIEQQNEDLYQEQERLKEKKADLETDIFRNRLEQKYLEGKCEESKEKLGKLDKVLEGLEKVKSFIKSYLPFAPLLEEFANKVESGEKELQEGCTITGYKSPLGELMESFKEKFQEHFYWFPRLMRWKTSKGDVAPVYRDVLNNGDYYEIKGYANVESRAAYRVEELQDEIKAENRVGTLEQIEQNIEAVEVQIVCLIAFPNDLYNAIGLWSGVAIGSGMAIHMKHSIEDALDLGETGAVKHVRMTYALRITGVLILMGCVLYFDLVNPLTLLARLIALKISAYLQPYMHKLFLKLKKSK